MFMLGKHLDRINKLTELKSKDFEAEALGHLVTLKEARDIV
jgi:hypothetical protein